MAPVTTRQRERTPTRADIRAIAHAAIRAQLGALLDGELDPHERHDLDAHLARCAGCRAYLRTFERTVELLQRLPRTAAPPAACARLLGRVPREGRERHAMLTALTSILLGLEIHQTRTPLSARQARIVEHALRAARELRAGLEERSAEVAGLAS